MVGDRKAWGAEEVAGSNPAVPTDRKEWAEHNLSAAFPWSEVRHQMARQVCSVNTSTRTRREPCTAYSFLSLAQAQATSS